MTAFQRGARQIPQEQPAAYGGLLGVHSMQTTGKKSSRKVAFHNISKLGSSERSKRE